jgi:CelD/BcsL family acetyltransferase involved in cellulose biosynthesis
VLPAVTRTFDAAERNNPRQHLLGPQWGPFTKAMLTAAARADALRLFVGWVDDRVASFIVALRDEHQLALWLNRFDPEFADIGPGHLMLKTMVEYGFDHDVERIDFLLGDFRYKRSWCTDSIDTVTVTGAQRRSTVLTGDVTRSLLRRARAYTGRPS